MDGEQRELEKNTQKEKKKKSNCQLNNLVYKAFPVRFSMRAKICLP